MYRYVVIAAALALAGCTNSTAAEKALLDHGYTDIETTGFRWNACYMPMTSTGFRAKNSQGRVVQGVACEGMDGAFEIRLYQ